MQHPSPVLRQLLALEPLKTWSLIVTLLGDRRAPLTGGEIRALLDPLGLRPEAIRVALHRLKADGWITSSKSGRQGMAETEAVRADIYGGAEKFPQGWVFVLTRGEALPAPAIAIARDGFVVPREALHPPDMMLLRAETLPEWVEDCLVPEGQRQLAAQLHAILTEAGGQSPDEAASLRIVILHHWRRLALRHGTWAHISLFPEGAVAACRRAVLARL